jgi:hypothetical protein
VSYHFWGIIDEEPETPSYRHFNGVPVPLPAETLPDWTWAEWVQEQGIGE